MNTAITSPTDALAYMLAGRATVTLVSQRTGTRYTYRLEAPREVRGTVTHFVRVLTGPDNTSDYSYLGVVDGGEIRTTAKSRVTPDSAPVRALQWTMRKLAVGEMPADLEVYHSGCCGKCGRALTVPESVRTGLGPTCARGVR